ncbi:hypothetical protein MMYC01_208929, partial [Madurella mycetomatis]
FGSAPGPKDSRSELAQRGPKGGGRGGGGGDNSKPASDKPGVDFVIDPLAPLNVLPWLAPPPGEAPPPQKRDIKTVYNELIARNPEAEPIIGPVFDIFRDILGN